jgi:HlyD family secretion protein
MKTLSTILFLGLLLSLMACADEERADAYGNFESTSILVSAERTAKIEKLEVDEGLTLQQYQVVGVLDTIHLHLKKESLTAKREVIQANSSSVLAEINVLTARLNTAKINRQRIQNMLDEGAATPQQLDNIQGEINTLQQQINSVKSKNASVLSELQLIDIQLKEAEDLVQKSIIKSPIHGRVLTTYAEASEVAAYGKALFKIADLSNLEVRAYISEPQLTSFSLGDSVKVKVDAQEGMLTYTGKITWIADEAEFTPKIIQTKEERVALVYAIKVEVKNDGKLKIGMPAEIWFN